MTRFVSFRCWNPIQSNRVRFSLNCGADWDTDSACTLRQRRGERTEDTAEGVAENSLRKLEPLEYMGPRSCGIRVSCKVVVMIGGLKDNLQRCDKMVRKVIDNLYTWCLQVSFIHNDTAGPVLELAHSCSVAVVCVGFRLKIPMPIFNYIYPPHASNSPTKRNRDYQIVRHLIDFQSAP